MNELTGNKKGNEEHPYDVKDPEPRFFARDPFGQEYRESRYAEGNEQPKQSGKIIGIKVVMDHVPGRIDDGTAAAKPIYKESAVYKAIRDK